MTQPSLAQSLASPPAPTGVFVILTAKAGVEREAVMAAMPEEIRETVRLHLSGKIRQWFARADGRGAVFLLDSKDVSEAHELMEAMPLAKRGLLDHEYIAVGPLAPLRLLLAET